MTYRRPASPYRRTTGSSGLWPDQPTACGGRGGNVRSAGAAEKVNGPRHDWGVRMRVSGTSLFTLVAATLSAGSFLLVGEYMHADTQNSITQKMSVTSTVAPAPCSRICDDGSDVS